MLNFLVIGCGSIGERHIRNLISMGISVFCYDRNPMRIENMVKNYQVGTYDFKSLDYIPIDAFIICTPPDSHIPLAHEAIRHNSHIFIEKPISNRLENISGLIQDAGERNLLIQIGYQFRFHPGLMLAKKLLDEGKIGRLLSIRAEFGQYLPDWHPKEDYRKLYTCYEEQGGGIILDASHEIDYVRWLAGSEVKMVSCFADHLSNLEVNVEDTAEINLRFENGVIGNIHIDMVQREYHRSCKLIGEEANISWEYPRLPLLIQPKQEVIDIPDKDMYFEEMKHFVFRIQEKEKPIVDAETGKKILQIALACKQSSKENKVIEI